MAGMHSLLPGNATASSTNSSSMAVKASSISLDISGNSAPLSLTSSHSRMGRLGLLGESPKSISCHGMPCDSRTFRSAPFNLV
jgi:hypothetical protein